MKDLKYLMAYTVPLSVVVSFYFGGVFSYTSLVYVFVFIPLVELLLPVQDVMFSENQVNTRLKNKMFDWLLYLNVPIVYALLFFGLYVFATYSFDTYVYFGLCPSITNELTDEIERHLKKVKPAVSQLDLN